MTCHLVQLEHVGGLVVLAQRRQPMRRRQHPHDAAMKSQYREGAVRLTRVAALYCEPWRSFRETRVRRDGPSVRSCEGVRCCTSNASRRRHLLLPPTLSQSMANLSWVITGRSQQILGFLLDGGLRGEFGREACGAAREGERHRLKVLKISKSEPELRRVLVHLTSPSQGTCRTDRNPTGLSVGSLLYRGQTYKRCSCKKTRETWFVTIYVESEKTKKRARRTISEIAEFQILSVFPKTASLMSGGQRAFHASSRNRRSFNLAFERASARHVERH